MYGLNDKLWFISKYAQKKYGDKPVTLEQLKHSVTMMTHALDPETLNKYVKYCTEDFDELAHPQFNKNEDGTFTPTPNAPKTPREIMNVFHKSGKR